MVAVVHEWGALQPFGQQVVQGGFALRVGFELRRVGVREVGAVLPLAVGSPFGVPQAQQLLDFAELELRVCLGQMGIVATMVEQVNQSKALKAIAACMTIGA